MNAEAKIIAIPKYGVTLTVFKVSYFAMFHFVTMKETRFGKNHKHE